MRNCSGKAIWVIVVIVVVAIVAALAVSMIMKEKKLSGLAAQGMQMITDGKNFESQKAYTDAFKKYSGAEKMADSLLAIHKGYRALTAVKDQAVGARQTLIAKLLMDGDRFLREGKFREPPVENAWDAFQAVLDADPENQQAKDGLQRVIDEEKNIKDFWADQDKMIREMERQNKVAVSGGAEGGISDKDRETMENFINQYKIRLLRILERARYQNDVHGRLKIRLSVAKNGSISDIKFSPVGDSNFPPKIQDQIRGEIRTWKITGLTAKVEYETMITFIQ
jgi:hypothetical protein